jgi:hypothetical protein
VHRDPYKVFEGLKKSGAEKKGEKAAGRLPGGGLGLTSTGSLSQEGP